MGSMERINYKLPESIKMARHDRQEARQRKDRRLIRTLLVGLFIFEPMVFVKITSASDKKHEVKKIKPTHSVTLNLKDSELRGLKGNPVKKEETRSSEAPEEKLSQKTYEVFLNNQNLMKRLSENRRIYEKAAERTGVDWKILAAIHYREGEMSSSHSTVSGEKLGSKNPDAGKTYYSLLESAIESGKIFKRNLKFAYKREYSLDQETLERGFLAYNRGGSYAVRNIGPEKSPYVMNFYNEKYDHMVWPNSEAEPANLRGQENLMYGAETVYKILEQAEYEGKI